MRQLDKEVNDTMGVYMEAGDASDKVTLAVKQSIQESVLAFALPANLMHAFAASSLSIWT